MKTLWLAVLLVFVFIAPVQADCDIDPADLYNWQIMKQGIMNLGGSQFLALKLRNPDKNAKVKTALVFAHIYEGLIMAFQYEIDGITRTFLLNGDKYIEQLGKKKLI